MKTQMQSIFANLNYIFQNNIIYIYTSCLIAYLSHFFILFFTIKLRSFVTYRWQSNKFNVIVFIFTIIIIEERDVYASASQN